MSETTLRFFNAGLESIFSGPTGVNLSKTFRCALVSAGWALDVDATSFSASISPHILQNASGGLALRQVGAGDVTLADVGVISWDLSDVAFTATVGSLLCARYAILVQSAVDTPVAVFSLSDAETVAKIVKIVWP